MLSEDFLSLWSAPLRFLTIDDTTRIRGSGSPAEFTYRQQDAERLRRIRQSLHGSVFPIEIRLPHPNREQS